MSSLMTLPAREPVVLAAGAAARHPALELLLLFGSRARGDARETSDWDFGYLGGSGLDVDLLLADLVTATRSDRVDLVDLGRAGGQLRLRAARDGVIVFERRPCVFESFAFDAASFWCDAEPVLRRAYEQLLESAAR
jgi:predicted nucleotidyltransferase